MIIHDTFTLDRTYDAPVADVWRYWTDPELRALWFRAPEGWTLLERSQRFEVGGTEVLRGRMPSGTRTSYRATYHLIEPNKHIVTAYIMHIDDALLSATLASMELEPAGAATRLRYTEQGAFFDGNPESGANRKKGTSWHFDNLAEVLARHRSA